MTFQLPGGVSPQAEERLWKAGILTWDDYRRNPGRIFSAPRHQKLLHAIEQAETILAAGRLESLLQVASTAWLIRLYPLLQDRAVYLDIETTGLRADDPPTTAALCDRAALRLFVAGCNLQMLPQQIPPRAILVTYYGRSFDLPRLRRHLHTPLRYPHLDLGPLLKQLGYGPGLKSCLRQLRIARPEYLPQHGQQAAALWHRYRHGDTQALETLLHYNALDAALLEPLWAAAYNKSLAAWPLFRPVPIPILQDVQDTVRRFVDYYNKQ